MIKTCVLTIPLNHGRTVKAYSSGWVRVFRENGALALVNGSFTSAWTRQKYHNVKGQPLQGWNGQPQTWKTDDKNGAIAFAESFASRFNKMYPADYFTA